MTEDEQDEIVKLAILGLIGVWGKPDQYGWRVAKGLTADDRLGELFQSV